MNEAGEIIFLACVMPKIQSQSQIRTKQNDNNLSLKIMGYVYEIVGLSFSIDVKDLCHSLL